MRYSVRMPYVRTTIDPYVEQFVSDDEYARLELLGLIYTGANPMPRPAFTLDQYKELADPNGIAIKRILENVGYGDILDATTAATLAAVQPTIDSFGQVVDGYSDQIADNLATVTERADALELAWNADAASITPVDGILADGAVRILPVGQGEFGLRPEWFGAIGDNATDDTAALQRAWNYASTHTERRWRILLSKNYKITDTIYWNCYRVSVSGPGQITSAINDAAKYMVRTFSTDPAQEGSPVRQRAITWDGVILYGDGVTGGLNIGGATGSDKPAHLTFRNCTIARMGVGVYFGWNAYMISFFGCNISLSRVGVWHDDMPNSGERIEFFGCDITGHGVAVKITSGQAMHFISCSFSYVLRRILETTFGQVFMTACHFEFNAPYAAFFLLSGSGAYCVANASRWLIRDPSPSVSSGLTFPANGTTVVWADNPRDRWGEGDPITFVGLTGATGLSDSTIYYMRNVTNTGFQISATRTGAIISWTGAGTATGLLADASAPIFSLGHISANATVRDGHVHGSATGIKTWADGVGARSFEIEGTATFGSTPLRMRTRLGGDLRDAAVTTAGVILDDWEGVGDCQISTSTDVSSASPSVNSILITRTGTGSARADLWLPIAGMSRILWMFNYKGTVGMTINQSAYLSTVRRSAGQTVPALGSNLWSSNMNFTTGWQSYIQDGQNDRRTPRWGRYLVIRFDLQNLPNGESLKIDYPEPSFL